jgi:hypothetical protein
MAMPIGFAMGGETSQPLVDAEQKRTIIKAVVRATDAWRLTNEEASALFDVPIATWNRMKASTFRGTLDRDKLTRASLIVGLYKGLRLLFNGPLTYCWPKTPNKGPGFDGRTPLAVMIEGGIPAMIRVRDHIDALRGGA